MPDEPADESTDRAELERIVAVFFAAFVSDGPPGRWDELRELFLPEAIIVRTCGGEPARYDVDGFLAPRADLLTSGALAEFREWAEPGRIDLFGDIAHWFGAYGKSGRQDGVAFTGRGMKSIQFVRIGAGWRISAAAWDDERPAT